MTFTKLTLLALLGAAPALAVLPDTDLDGYPDTLDCAPDDPSVHPRAVEIPYDGIDQDCAGGDLCDVDLDGHDDPLCGGDDCNDADDTVRPTAVDIPGDGIDQDCDGVDAEVRCDGDGDAYLAAHCGGDDCNDLDSTVHPGAIEIDADGIDQDCDGVDDCVPVQWAQGGWCSTGPAAPGLLALLPLALLRRRRGHR